MNHIDVNLRRRFYRRVKHACMCLTLVNVGCTCACAILQSKIIEKLVSQEVDLSITKSPEPVLSEQHFQRTVRQMFTDNRHSTPAAEEEINKMSRKIKNQILNANVLHW